MAILLFGALFPAVQSPPSDEGFLVAALLRAQAERARIEADIGDVEADLETNRLMINDAEEKLAIAFETRNRQASVVPGADLRRLRAARRKILKAQSQLEQDRMRTEGTCAVLRTMIVTGRRPAPDTRILGLASLRSGNVLVIEKSGKKVSLKGDKPGFLGLGDEVSVKDGGRAEVHILDGRGLIQMDGLSRLEIYDDTSEEQATRLVQGRAYWAIDRLEDLERTLRGGFGGADADLDPILARYRDLPGPEMSKLFGRDLKIRVPAAICTVRSARFSLEIRSDGTAEVAVFEGMVDVGGLDDGKHVLIEEGFTAVVLKNAVSEPRKIVDFDKWWEDQS